MNTSHYPSLELCKKLTKIGFTGELTYTEKDGFYVQPSVMEMLDIIPREIIRKGFGRGYLSIQATDISYSVAYLFEGVPRGDYFARDTLANALAEMALWLYQNNYISFTK